MNPFETLQLDIDASMADARVRRAKLSVLLIEHSGPSADVAAAKAVVDRALQAIQDMKADEKRRRQKWRTPTLMGGGGGVDRSRRQGRKGDGNSGSGGPGSSSDASAVREDAVRLSQTPVLDALSKKFNAAENASSTNGAHETPVLDAISVSLNQSYTNAERALTSDDPESRNILWMMFAGAVVGTVVTLNPGKEVCTHFLALCLSLYIGARNRLLDANQISFVHHRTVGGLIGAGIGAGAGAGVNEITAEQTFQRNAAMRQTALTDFAGGKEEHHVLEMRTKAQLPQY